tara:strand:+ start:1755 stop:2972 length:1218 start_codon:yes stop_codon:yes gene_type:complete
MNIKKIIRESFEDEFNWVEDVPLNPFLVEQGNTYFVNIDMNLTEEQSRLVWDWLIEAGLTTTHQVIQYGRVEKLTKQKGTYMAIKSNGDFRYNIKKHVPSVQIKVLKISDFLNKEEDLKEEQIDLFGGEDSKYERCSHFSNNPKHKELCFNLYTLGTFLYKDLGLKNIINQKIRLMGEVKDLNDKYQEPLELVYNTGKFGDIRKEDGVYHTDKLVDVGTLYDKDGTWHYINKLNTNYADLAELLTELFIRGNIADKLSNKNKLGLKKYLSSIKDKLINVLDKYISLDEYKSFIRNSKHLSQKGEQAEDDVRKVLENFGMKTLYTGGHGDFIDMLYGIDLIMDYKGKNYLIQVKNTEDQALKSAEYPRYRKLDYFAAPTNFGIIIKNTDGRITKLNQEGEVINDSE